MDTLDKIEDTLAAPVIDSDVNDDVETGQHEDAHVAEIVDEVVAVSRKVNWWKIAGYAAAGVAIAGAVGGYAYLKAQEKKPKNRLARLRGQLGLDPVDMSRLPASLRDIDFSRVRKTGRDVGIYAKKATHVGAKKVADLTR